MNKEQLFAFFGEQEPTVLLSFLETAFDEMIYAAIDAANQAQKASLKAAVVRQGVRTEPTSRK